jgi:pimeloyl-ACP methyl ester carboxylesterase
MSNQRLVRKDHLILIAAAPMLIIASSLIGIDGYFGTPKIVHSQSDQDQMNSDITNSVNMQDIPLEKVRVGDIDVAYKMFGQGDPILLISGLGAGMNEWPSSILEELSSSNHTIIVFDSRGVGNTTAGAKLFSIQQFANDTAGLLDGLKLQKVDVLGFSMGSFVAQQLTLTHPEEVNRLILHGATCGGKEGIPPSPEVVKLGKKLTNATVNNTPVEPQELKAALSVTLGPTWMKLHPNYIETIPTTTNPRDLLSDITPNAFMQQFNAVQNWYASNWSGVCSQLSNISIPTLIITGTDDISVPAANSLILAQKISGAWLVQIQGAGHALMSQYPDEFNKVLQAFLSTTTPLR